MASNQEDVLRPILHSSDSLQCVLEVELAAEQARSLADQTDTPFRRRLIAVITRRSYSKDTEVGSLLVANTSTKDSGATVVDALPITEHLSLVVAQSATLDSQATASDQRSSAWMLTIRRGAQDARSLSFIIYTRDTQTLQRFTAECRRLREIASAYALNRKLHERNAETLSAAMRLVGSDFSWVEAYVSDSSRRLDLRIRIKPLHARLSPATAGSPGDDVSDIAIIRRYWVQRAAAKEASCGNVMHLKIRLGTFNVNGKSPSQDLHPWLQSSQPRGEKRAGWISPLQLSPFEILSDPLQQELRKNQWRTSVTDPRSFEDPDMLILGFQELDLSAEALLYTTSTLKEDEWTAAIFAGLGEKHILYEKLASRQLVGMLLVIIVKKALVPCFTDVRLCNAGAGIMGFMGNKGATAIRFEFTPQKSSDSQTVLCRSTVLTFVNAHLAASDDMAERRNYDFQELNGRLTFPSNKSGGSYPSTSFAEDTYSIYQSDILFWMGGDIAHSRQRSLSHSSDLDLNYRLDLPDGDIRHLLFSHVSGISNTQTLLQYDQLTAAMRSNKAFSGFTEYPITHLPTYRLALGVSKDQLGYDIKRKPAWTDRVLYMAPPDVKVEQLAYGSHPEITMSDHHPVSADFDISLPIIDQSRYEDAISALHRELANLEDIERGPKLKIQPASTEFGTVKYKLATHREVVIRNEGHIPCTFRFLGTRTGPEVISPSWLRIEPMVGLLRPQESMSILLTVYVDNEAAAELNMGPPIFSCTLILHTALGKDDFLSVSGHYQYTCFANTLKRLTQLRGPIRKFEPREEVFATGQVISAPNEIMRLINWMMTHVSAADTLFEYPAGEDLCHIIRECLDTGDEFPCEGPDADHRALVMAFASTLVLFLDSLVEPVVPAHLHGQCVQASDKDEAFEVLDGFPHESINVWVSLSAFLHYVARQSDAFRADSNSQGPGTALKLASIFAPVLLRDDPTGVYPRVSPVEKRDFLLLFIE